MAKLKFWLNPVGLTWSENLLLCQTSVMKAFDLLSICQLYIV